MDKKLCFLVIILCMNACIVFAEKSIVYNANIDGSKINVNLLIEFESEEEVNVFEGSLSVPENTTVEKISDSKGKIKEFNVNDSVLYFKTNYSVKKKAEIVNIEMVWQGIINDEFSPLYCPTISFSGITDYKTKIIVNADRILSFSASLGFETFYSEKQIKIESEGPANITLCFAKNGAGKESEHFVLFNSNEDLGEADKLFYIIPLALGVKNVYSKYPILVLDDKIYDEKVNTYSQGAHRNGGFSIIRKSVFDKKEEKEHIATVLHEVTHAINEWVFKWNNTSVAWFDEGVAKTIERIVKKQLGERTPNLFYKSVVYIEGPQMIALMPQSDWEELLEYYSQNKDFMETWNPSKDQEFGYAYSELFVKKYLSEQGFNGLQQVYKEFLKNEERIIEGAQFTEKIIKILQSEKKPCYYLEQENLQTCLDKVNSFNPVLPTKTEVLVMGNLLEKPEEQTIMIDSDKIKQLEKQQFIKAKENISEKMHQIIKKVFNSLGIALKNMKFNKD